MNLKLQMLDSQLSQKVDKYKTKVLENKSLQFEVTKAEGKGGGSKSYVTNQKKLERASEKRNKQQKKLQVGSGVVGLCARRQGVHCRRAGGPWRCVRRRVSQI